MALLRFASPLHPMLELQRELDRMFERPAGLDLGLSGRGVFPAVNIFSDKDSYVAYLEVPGVAPDQLKIETHGHTLTVSGNREVTLPEGGSFHRRERSTGEFSRSIQLPDEFDPSRADASYKYGVLTLRIPKHEDAKPRQITVKAA